MKHFTVIFLALLCLSHAAAGKKAHAAQHNDADDDGVIARAKGAVAHGRASEEEATAALEESQELEEGSDNAEPELEEGGEEDKDEELEEEGSDNAEPELEEAENDGAELEEDKDEELEEEASDNAEPELEEEASDKAEQELEEEGSDNAEQEQELEEEGSDNAEQEQELEEEGSDNAEQELEEEGDEDNGQELEEEEEEHDNGLRAYHARLAKLSPEDSEPALEEDSESEPELEESGDEDKEPCKNCKEGNQESKANSMAFNRVKADVSKLMRALEESGLPAKEQKAAKLDIAGIKNDIARLESHQGNAHNLKAAIEKRIQVLRLLAGSSTQQLEEESENDQSLEEEDEERSLEEESEEGDKVEAKTDKIQLVERDVHALEQALSKAHVKSKVAHENLARMLVDAEELNSADPARQKSLVQAMKLRAQALKKQLAQ